ncbi:alcohol dehydrogenase catalytic domain-containing protein [Bifidobacterium dentium]|uniref:alcohol dehydrogenase catalytic domain-containing protein n=1 Tax=Bifidobacterium dentium TaxID=1689 RepID=UPI00321B0CF1
MKSWRFTGTNEPLRLEELPEPSAGPGKVVIDVKAAGICHTDVGILTDPGWMTMLGQVPVTLGHEDAGVISAVGDGVTDFKVGDRVAICPTTSAGCPGSSFDGGFGPKIVIGTEALVRIPDEVDFVNGAAATDAGMTSYAAVVRRGGVRRETRSASSDLAGLAKLARGWRICLVRKCMWLKSRRTSGRLPRNSARWTYVDPSRTSTT